VRAAVLAGERYHLFGVGGRGMAPLAIAAQYLGAEVTGCDRASREDTRPYLVDAGLTVEDRHSVDHVVPGTRFVATSVASPEEPELQLAAENGEVWHRTDLLAHLLRQRPGVGISGSHGKGTVTALTAAALEAAGLDPLAVIGVPVPELGGIARLGVGPLVAEVDDSDLTLRRVATEVAVVTNLDEDHPHLDTPLHLATEAVGEFVSRARRTVVLGPSPRATSLEAYAAAVVWRYGRDFTARSLAAAVGETELELRGPGGERERATVRLLGPRTAENAAVAFVTALAFGAEPSAAAAGLGGVTSIRRRLEPVGIRDGVRVFDDFGGKHPVNVRLGIQTLRRHFPAAGVTAVFEPYGPYLARWGHRYARALSAADRVVMAPPIFLDDYARGRAPGSRWIDACSAPTVRVDDRRAAAEAAVRLSRPGDVLVVFAQAHAAREMALLAAGGDGETA
jgi:UDP-N-acetylmuramate--alanine ligase